MANLKFFVCLTVSCLLAAVLATEINESHDDYQKWLEEHEMNRTCKRMRSVTKVDETHAPYTEINYRCRLLKPKYLFLIKCDGICQDPNTGQPLVGYRQMEEKKTFCVWNPRKCKDRGDCFKITISCQCVPNT